ncbi:alpha-galactosidase [Chitinophagaceae bacterium LB-8]|uniref:Alpha-galactosidase n=1 Tax=Paraflavisolibacter caeni TaxID=2982496 RepID=A0A9X2XPZ6_9BACT|nr:alpha-galactosidase [Paraflavisolibacter caeni]MCU7552224.1 alpha-galactosidase [Paraflavisolibacter caeni]
MTKIKAIFLWLTIANTNLLFAQQNNLAIRNNSLTATFNVAQKTFEVKDIATGIIFLRKGIAKDVAKAVSVSVTDPVFGKGQAIQLMKPDGGNYIMALYPQVPFLFIRETIANRGKETLELQKVSSCSFQVDLQKPVAGMKTLGTGGLHTPTDNPGSYVFLTTVWPQTREGVVTGWLTNERGSGVVFSDTSDSRVSIRPQIDYGRLLVQAGAQTPLETLLVGYFKDARVGEEEYAATIARHQHIQLPPRKAVYCTWYSEKNGGAGNEKSTDELTSFIAKSLKPYGLGVVQIDDEWQDGGNFNGPRRGFDRVKPNGPYPNGMTPTANIIKQNGLTAGIWWMPFSRNHQDPEYKDRQSWFARRLDGKPYETTWGGTSLDITNPQVQQHLAQTAKTLRNWGFNYFKMDGLWTGTVTEQVYINDGYKDDHIGNCKPLYDSSKTQIEAFRMGLKLLRNNVGKDVFFSGCCISQNMRSFGASIGLVNAMRVGPDYNHDGQTIRTGPLRASRLYFLNGRVWWNDPDPSIIRQSGTATADGACKGIGSLTRARLMPSWVALTGQFFLSSDWLPNLPEERLDIMKRCMLSHNGTARPVDAFDRTLPATWLATDKHTNVERNVIGLFNWDTTKQQIGCGTAWAGLKKNTAYYAFDFWENKVLPDIAKEFAFELPGESCKIIAVRAKANHPVLVSTSKHITQGMVDVKEETWSNATLSGKSELVGGDPYEMRIAGLADNGNWSPEKVDVTGLEGATIKILPVTEKGWVRVVIQSEKSGIAQWRIKFRNKV